MSIDPAAAQNHECQRCGSDEWEYIDYGGCSVCRPHEEREAEDELCDFVPDETMFDPGSFDNAVRGVETRGRDRA